MQRPQHGDGNPAFRDLPPPSPKEPQKVIQGAHRNHLEILKVSILSFSFNFSKRRCVRGVAERLCELQLSSSLPIMCFGSNLQLEAVSANQ